MVALPRAFRGLSTRTQAHSRDQWSLDIHNRMARYGIKALRPGEKVLVAFDRGVFGTPAAKKHGDIAVIKRGSNGEYLRNSGYLNSNGSPWKAVPLSYFRKSAVYAFRNRSMSESVTRRAEGFKGRVHYCYRNIKKVLGIWGWIASKFSSKAGSAYQFNHIPANELAKHGIFKAGVGLPSSSSNNGEYVDNLSPSISPKTAVRQTSLYEKLFGAGGQPKEINARENASHTIKKGESLWSILMNKGIRPTMEKCKAIAKANGISNPDLIFAGTQINLNLNTIA